MLVMTKDNTTSVSISPGESLTAQWAPILEGTTMWHGLN